jgi:hypothetical protein
MATDLRLEFRLKVFDLDLSSLRKNGATQGRGKHEHDPAQSRGLGGIGRGGVKRAAAGNRGGRRAQCRARYHVSVVSTKLE